MCVFCSASGRQNNHPSSSRRRWNTSYFNMSSAIWSRGELITGIVIFYYITWSLSAHNELHFLKTINHQGICVIFPKSETRRRCIRQGEWLLNWVNVPIVIPESLLLQAYQLVGVLCGTRCQCSQFTGNIKPSWKTANACLPLPAPAGGGDGKLPE